MSDTSDRLVALLVRVCGLEADEISPEVTFRKLEVDSLALVELGLAAQQEFGVPIKDDELELDATVADAAAMVEKKLAAGQPGVTG
ncbi:MULTISPECIES: acyl carrier protein [unclassified Streptomyces]|jgi:Acyl carrier protein|uniref:acyl carrier protein n=1 Tax=unclassified Streptomyces TaxID=2593676 RepID=UPI002E270017